MQQPAGVAASLLCAPLVDGPERRLHVVHQSRLAWQLADDDGLVVMCVIHHGAVRLPSAIALLERCEAPLSVSVGDGAVMFSGQRLPVVRWWRPARPRTPLLRGRVAVPAVLDLAREVPHLVGLGPGLTPYGDDVVCGALVAGLAAAPDLVDELVGAVRRLDLTRCTTATSAQLLRNATQGWCIDEVAHYLQALSMGTAVGAARVALLRVGHSSGAGLLEGIHRVLPALESEAAA